MACWADMIVYYNVFILQMQFFFYCFFSLLFPKKSAIIIPAQVEYVFLTLNIALADV